MPETKRSSKKTTVRFVGNGKILRTVFQPRALSSDIVIKARLPLISETPAVRALDL